jgi:hypothetical protein
VSDLQPVFLQQQPLPVHYTDTARAAYAQLEERLQHTLVKAMQILANDPFPPQSEAASHDGLTRRVQASQSLVLEYRASETRLLVQGVTLVPADPAPQEHPPADPAPAGPTGQWEVVTVVPPPDPRMQPGDRSH